MSVTIILMLPAFHKEQQELSSLHPFGHVEFYWNQQRFLTKLSNAAQHSSHKYLDLFKLKTLGCSFAKRVFN